MGLVSLRSPGFSGGLFTPGLGPVVIERALDLSRADRRCGWRQAGPCGALVHLSSNHRTIEHRSYSPIWDPLATGIKKD